MIVSLEILIYHLTIFSQTLSGYSYKRATGQLKLKIGPVSNDFTIYHLVTFRPVSRSRGACNLRGTLTLV